ncbi:MAG: metallophosphoesterase [Pseudohongiella nitratireducens]|nr:metallophosphoesterase [Pseudohongiella nitratireducens]
MSTKIAYASDLHLRQYHKFFNQRAMSFPESSDVIVLAGDIAIGHEASDIVDELSEQYPSSHIVWVAGNHEFYGTNIDVQTDYFRQVCATSEQVHFLENASVEIKGITFIGCTLWSDFSILGDSEEAKNVAGQSINDFFHIETAGGQRFTPDHAVLKFQESHSYLESQLSQLDPLKTVVVTHFPPGMNTRNTKYPIDPLTAYFQANVEELITTYQPSNWIYGHNHFSNQIQISQTNVVSNQLGYRSEEGRIPPYSPNKLITFDL